MMDPLSYEEGVWIRVVAMLTEAVKRLWPIRAPGRGLAAWGREGCASSPEE